MRRRTIVLVVLVSLVLVFLISYFDLFGRFMRFAGVDVEELPKIDVRGDSITITLPDDDADD